MKKLTFLLFVWLLLTSSLMAQVSTTPSLPIENQSVKVFFNATQGSRGLANYTGNIYAHTGVITDKSTNNSDWKYVISDWNQNIPKAKMVRESANIYSIEISPDIRTFYNVPDDEKIIKLAFVFRSADGSKEGKDQNGNDIFVNVYQDGLNISITEPQKTIIDKNISFNIKADATQSASLSLYVNETLIYQTEGNSISNNISVNGEGYHWLIAEAEKDDITVRDSIQIFVKKPTLIEAKPNEYKQGINYTSDTTIALVLFAPYKENVFVMGDFNNWKLNNNFQMKKDGDYFWLEIDGLIKGKEYVFQYLIDGKLKIADPYSTKIVDPWNDQYISNSTYPNLIEYPLGKTEGIATVIQTNQAPYNWENDSFTPPQKEKMVIYEMLIRDFTNEHTFTSIIEKLDYLADLNINVLELMPINEFEGNSSWGYNPSFYFAVDKYYGTANQFKTLVDSCHSRGIAVVIDIVLNHSFGQSPLAQMYMDNWTITAENPWYNVSSPNQTYSWGYDFNHESDYTKAFIDSVNSYWMEEFKIDGFRFDFTKGFTNKPGDGWEYDSSRIKILKRMADEIWKRNDNAIIILEHLSNNQEEKELANYGFLLWGNMNYNYAEGVMGYTENNKSDISGSIYTERNWSQPNLIAYPESHDEERIAFKAKTYGKSYNDYNVKDLTITMDRLELAALFYIPIPGPKMIWQFGELGYDYSINYNDRTGEKPIKWEYTTVKDRTDLFQVISSLNYLKANFPEFNPADFDYQLSDALKWLRLSRNNNHIMIVGNFDVVPQTINIDFPKMGKWFNYFEKTTIDVTDPKYSLELQPGEYKLFSSRALTHPEIVTEVQEFKNYSSFKIYPNPTNGFVQLENNLDFEIAEIFDLNGKLVKSLALKPYKNTIKLNNLSKGTYLMKLSNQKQSSVEKLIID